MESETVFQATIFFRLNRASSFWSPGCVWVGGYDNMTVKNNDFTNAPFTPVNIKVVYL